MGDGWESHAPVVVGHPYPTPPGWGSGPEVRAWVSALWLKIFGNALGQTLTTLGFHKEGYLALVVSHIHWAEKQELAS